MRAVKFLLGMIIGAMLGAVAVLLIAPQSGEETQRMITEKFEGIISEGKKAYEERRIELEQQINAMHRE